MDCVYGIKNCSCSKCAHCGLCTNGSQVHRSCFKFLAEDEEVAQLMAGPEESLPTSTEEKIADALQSDEVLSEEAYYVEMGELHDEEYKRVSLDIKTFRKTLVDCIPESGIVDGKITINRYLNSNCSIVMYRLMKTVWDNIIREEDVNMVAGLYFDLYDRVSYHEWCIPENRTETCSEACIKIVNFKNCDLSEYISENLGLFFCSGW